MDKVLARYFVKLIAENLQFSFNGMGIPSYSCEWLENQLMQGNYDEVEEFIKKRYDEHENSAKDTNVRGKKRKRKFRAMTISEWCDPKKCPKCEYHYGAFYCAYSIFNGLNRGQNKSKSYKKRNGKYILVEVTNDAGSNLQNL